MRVAEEGEEAGAAEARHTSEATCIVSGERQRVQKVLGQVRHAHSRVASEGGSGVRGSPCASVREGPTPQRPQR